MSDDNAEPDAGPNDEERGQPHVPSRTSLARSSSSVSFAFGKDTMTHVSPGELEVFGSYSMHLGPRYEAAGLRIQFHYNQTPGFHFKAEAPSDYRDSILRGLQDGLALRFPKFPATASVWITEVAVHEVDSSQRAFYRAARMVVDQAFAIANQYVTNAEPSDPPNDGPATSVDNSEGSGGARHR